MNNKLINLLYFSLMIGQYSCKEAKVIQKTDFRPFNSVYSGIWNNLEGLPLNIIIEKCDNCTFAVNESVQMIKPTDANDCKLLYRVEKNKKIDTAVWQVKQVPIPNVVFTPYRHGIQSDSVYFLSLQFNIDKHYDFQSYIRFRGSNNNLLSQYKIVYYEYFVLDKNDRIMYEGLWTDPILDCPGTLVILDNIGKGAKLLFKNLSVSLPDGSTTDIKVDTIFLK